MKATLSLPTAPDLFFASCNQKLAGLESLSLEEQSILEQSLSETNRIKFRLGRVAAKLALAKIGVKSGVLRDKDGAPIWPQDVVGSISHCKEFGVACVGKSAEFLTVGIDIEDTSRSFKYPITSRIATQSEQLWCKSNSRYETGKAISLFAAKEALYKALAPLVKRYFGFHAAELLWLPESSSFQVTLLESLSPEFHAGFKCQAQIHFSNPYVIAWVAIRQVN